MRSFPECLEVKRKLDGTEHRFRCDLVTLADSHGILRYLVTRHGGLPGLRLWPGCVTYAVYWLERPYNVYWWQDPAGASLGFYFNVADSVDLTPAVFGWRDLTVDVLVYPDGRADVLDEAELPPDLEPALRRHIEEARDAILASAAALTAEASALVAQALARA